MKVSWGSVVCVGVLGVSPLVGGGAVRGAASTMSNAGLRMTDFTPSVLGLLESPNADGMAKLKFYIDPINGPSVRAHVHLYDFVSGTTYGVNIETDQGGRDAFDIVTTNPAGNGNVVITFPVSAAPSAAIVLVYRDTLNNDSWDPTEERAVGVSN